MRKPVYTHFAERKNVYQIIMLLRIIFIQSLVKNKPKKTIRLKMYWWLKKSIVFAYAWSFMSFFFFLKLSPMSSNEHNLWMKYNFCIYIFFFYFILNNLKTWKKLFFSPINVSGLKRLTCLKYELWFMKKREIKLNITCN